MYIIIIISSNIFPQSYYVYLIESWKCNFPMAWSVRRMVCHNLLNGREVQLKMGGNLHFSIVPIGALVDI